MDWEPTRAASVLPRVVMLATSRRAAPLCPSSQSYRLDICQESRSDQGYSGTHPRAGILPTRSSAAGWAQIPI